jgi:hypothetical protein
VCAWVWACLRQASVRVGGVGFGWCVRLHVAKVVLNDVKNNNQSTHMHYTLRQISKCQACFRPLPVFLVCSDSIHPCVSENTTIIPRKAIHARLTCRHWIRIPWSPFRLHEDARGASLPRHQRPSRLLCTSGCACLPTGRLPGCACLPFPRPCATAGRCVGVCGRCGIWVVCVITKNENRLKLHHEYCYAHTLAHCLPQQSSIHQILPAGAKGMPVAQALNH